MTKRIGLCCVLLALFILAGCNLPLNPVSSPAQDQAPFLPPTPVSGAAPEATASPDPVGEATAPPASQPTPGADCRDNLTFVSDVTIPDGTEVEAQSTLDKRWEVENSGECNWSEAYRVRLIAGPEMGAQKEQSLYPARSGTHATIRIQFKAPTEPGSYRSAWQAIDPQGEPFGDPFFIEITVIE